MELKLNIGYQKLIELIKQLPANQIRKLKADLASIVTDNDMEKDRSDFQEFLLEGPVMEDDQYQSSALRLRLGGAYVAGDIEIEIILLSIVVLLSF